jgi:hypothetical protein
MRHFFVAVCMVLVVPGSSAQNISYGKSTYDLTGDPTTMVTPELNFSNTGSSTIQVFVKRILVNLPPNWTSCFCFINCHPPAIDTLRFNLVPGQNASIGVGFNTDINPGIGYVRLTVEEVGGTQKDTLDFSGSTLLSGIKENFAPSMFKLFPNPTIETLTIFSDFKDEYSIIITNHKGQTVKHFSDLKENTELSLRDLSVGVYFVTVKYKSGKTDTKQIIKN